jgi:hypothetical protein
VDDWDVEPKQVPENPDGTPKRSILRELAGDKRNEIEEEAPGRYRSRGHVPYPRG